MFNLILFIDIAIITVILAGIAYSIFFRKVHSYNRTKKTVIITASIATVGILIAIIGIGMNFYVIHTNNLDRKMPISKETIIKTFGKDFEFSRYDDDEHKVLDKAQIKNYSLCDRFYAKKIIFAKDICYSIGDVIITVGEFLFIFSLFIMTFVGIKYAVNN